jgi:hypothetical protein
VRLRTGVAGFRLPGICVGRKPGSISRLSGLRLRALRFRRGTGAFRGNPLRLCRFIVCLGVSGCRSPGRKPVELTAQHCQFPGHPALLKRNTAQPQGKGDEKKETKQ